MGEGVMAGAGSGRARGGWAGCLCLAAALGIVACSGSKGEDPGAAPGEVVSAPPREPGPAPSADAGPPTFDLDAAPPPTDASDPNKPKVRTIFAVDEAGRLARFAAASPGVVTSKTPVTGLAKDETILGIDFRPVDGVLYALGSTSRLYTIDKTTGAAKAVGPAFTPALAGRSFGFDFNPVADRIRVHSDFDQNLRLHPMTGAVAATDPSLAFAPGDPNEGQSPNLVATAYTNSVAPAPSATTLYGIDSTRNLLTKLTNPNDGKVTTVGSLGIDVLEAAGFDIWGSTASPLATEAYAALRTATAGSTTGLYKIDLATGKATLVGPIADDSPVTGIAVEP